MQKSGPLIQYGCCIYKKRWFGHRNTHRKNAYVKMKADMKVKHLQCKGHQRLPENHSKHGITGRGMEWICPQKEPTLPTSWFYSLQNSEIINFCCSGPPISYYLVMKDMEKITQLPFYNWGDGESWRWQRQSPGMKVGPSCPKSPVALAQIHNPPSSLTSSVTFYLTSPTLLNWESWVIPPRIGL